MQFFNNLDTDLKTALKAQLRDLWTHTSTAIEGNTLTLGETKFVIEEGLTISGKPLKYHQEVVGHARAIDLIYAIVDKDEIKDTDLFELHKAVMTQVVVDEYKPVGGWKKEPNGAYYFDE
jgi:Fic family protein